jgi:hypothetical protein
MKRRIILTVIVLVGLLVTEQFRVPRGVQFRAPNQKPVQGMLARAWFGSFMAKGITKRVLDWPLVQTVYAQDPCGDLPACTGEKRRPKVVGGYNQYCDYLNGTCPIYECYSSPGSATYCIRRDITCSTNQVTCQQDAESSSCRQ